MSTKDKIIKFFKSGKTITAAKATEKFGVKNFTARVAELREEGYPNIYANPKKVNGRKVAVYRLGTPTKCMKRLARSGDLTLAA